MAYKINGTTVVDNSRNVCACCVTSCCITASDRMDAPSGTTAQRPSSPSTGSVYFDTDLGALLSYDGSNWIAPSGGVGMGLASGLVNSDTEAWSATYISTDHVQCRGKTASCIYGTLVCGVLPCPACTSALYDECSVMSGTNTKSGSCFFSEVYNTFESGSGVRGRYGIDCFIRSCPMNFAQGYQNQVELGKACCNVIQGRIFNDGSFETIVGTTRQDQINSSICSNCQTTITIDKYGNNHLTVSMSQRQATSLPCCIFFPPENIYAYVNYTNNGLNAPLANLRANLQLYAGYVRDFGICHCTCAAFEICSDYLHQNGYEVCDTALLVCSPYSGNCDKYVHIAPGGGDTNSTQFYPLETGFNFGTGYITSISACGFGTNGLIYSGRTSSSLVYSMSTLGCTCNNLNAFTFLSKCPQYNYRDSSFYNPVSTTPSGAKIGTSDEGFTNSIGYHRNVGYATTPCVCSRSGFYSGEACGKSVAYWFSQDKCKLYHVYFKNCNCGSGWAKFSCSATQPTAGDRCFTCGVWPAVEVIDTTTGRVTCSVYYCQYKDAHIAGSTYPFCIDLCCLDFCRAAPYDSVLRSKKQGVVSWLEGQTQTIDGSASCMIRSCACPSRIYMLPDSDNTSCAEFCRASVFNECTLNFECQFPIAMFETCQLRENLKILISGSVGCCTPPACACLTCTFNCTFTSSSTPPCFSGGNIWHSLTCSYMPNNSYACQLCIKGLYPLTENESQAGINYYINPTNDHLVMLLSIGSCNTSCAQCFMWLGAVCWDIENCCISRVDTLAPTSGDKCLFALCKGDQCWGSCNIEDMCCAAQVATLNTYRSCYCSCKEHLRPLAYAKSFATRNHTCGGVVVFTTSNLTRQNSICSSCCFCPANSCFDVCLGYFGPCALGKCIVCNTCNGTNCKQGLVMQSTFGMARVPWEQPLSCSGLFEEDAGVKCIFEMLLGCHQMGCSLYCNSQTKINCFFCRNIVPEFNCKVDITCQYTCCCTAVYTWGSTCWCSRNRWVVFDTANTCVFWCQLHISCCKVSGGTWGSFMCCDLGGCLAARCAYETACPQSLTCNVCSKLTALGCVACLNPQRIPTVVMCVGSDTIFAGHSDHRQLTNPKGLHYVQGYDKELTRGYTSRPSGDVVSNGTHFGWFSYNNNACCSLTGANGSIKYWFDKYYARIL